VAKIAELLRSPQRRSLESQYKIREMIVVKEMFSGADGKQVGMEMTECQMAGSEFHRSDTATGKSTKSAATVDDDDDDET